MIQFYFLSVFLNILGGYSLCPDVSAVRGSPFDGVRSFLQDHITRIVLGILTAVTGAFKLLTVVHGDIPVVGDFLPAVAGIAVGAALLLDINEASRAAQAEGDSGSATAEQPASEARGAAPRGRIHRIARGKAERFLLDHKGAVGVAGIIAGVVHFFFPMVMFL